ncbi:MAG: hypothetical protein A2W80_12360 [Candidatus Riflebacteria bacterium GWC2_50_8]|nr:MAG: hypothetical protein A2W80_12360 [Candidatus Riflebacteria bacterium GWC2_50_8]
MRDLRLILCLVLVFVAGGLAAAGLTLYSYRDDLGQIIVVDSLERIPEQYRDNAKRSFIPAFRSAPPPKNPAPAFEAVPENNISVSPHQPVETDSFTVSAPPEEIEVETGLASATLTMEQLRLIHLNNERIYLAARDNGLQFPAIGHLHLSNGQLIVDFAMPTEMTTAAGTAWQKDARNFYDQLRSMHISITSWLSTNSPELVAAMPMLLTRAKSLLADLETVFSAIPTGK